MRRLVALGLALVLLGGCGHSVEPRAPYEEASAIPPPRALAAQVDVSRGVVLTWTASPEDRAIVDGWTVERRRTTEGTFVALTPSPIADTTFVDGDLLDGERAVYRVRGVTAAAVASDFVETAPVRADFVAPTAPTGVSATTAPGGIALAFTPGPEPDLALFEARLVPTSGTEPPTFRQFTASPTLLSGLVAGAEYAIEVTAIDSAGRVSPPSAPPVIAVAGSPGPGPGAKSKQ